MTEVSTPMPMLPPVEPSPVRDVDEPRRSGWWFWGSFAVFAGLLGLSFVVPAQMLGRIIPGHALIDEGTVANKPGSAQPTATRVSVDGFDVFVSEGEILFTTVAIDADVSVFDWLQSEIDDEIELKPRELVFGTRSLDENRARNLEMMQASKDTAIIAAFDRLGVTVVKETGIAFQLVLEDGPSAGLLVPGDVIIGIDGVEISSFASLRDELDQKVPGEQGLITVENIDTLEIRDVTIVWGEHPDGLEGGYIGVGEVVPRYEDLPLPFDVEIDSGSIGGPSAGLAFTLTIIDLLTEGELTGGQRIAVTGTMSAGGNVGNVGGVGQKAAAARESGAIAFIVPEASVETARAHAGDMPIIGVTTLDEALETLAGLGGDVDELRLDLGESIR